MAEAAKLQHPPGGILQGAARPLWCERAGSGEPVLLLSGLGPAGSHAIFHPEFDALASSHEVIFLDLHGRGASPRPPSLSSLTFDADVDDAASAIAALGRGPVHLYGFSYGGLLGQALALRHPEMLRSLVLANTLHSPEMWQANHANLNRELSNQYPELWDEIEELHAQGVPSTSPELQRRFAAAFKLVRFYNPDNAARVVGLADPLARNPELYPVFCGADVDFIIGGEVPRIPDFRPRLGDIACPVLVVAGRYDRALYPRLQRDFARMAPQARLVWMERSGSFAHVEEPEALLSLLRDFWREAGEKRG
jgi:proline-specific peptidase